jgi:hypothetical protein
MVVPRRGAAASVAWRRVQQFFFPYFPKASRRFVALKPGPYGCGQRSKSPVRTARRPRPIRASGGVLNDHVSHFLSIFNTHIDEYR